MLRPDAPDIVRFQAPAGLDNEEQLFQQAFGADAERFSLSFWQQSKCLVVPQRWQSMPDIDAAQTIAAAKGWPVTFRRSGGACVFHGPGVLCVSGILASKRDPVPVDRIYEDFANGLGAAVSSLGVSGVSIGSAPDAPCDGRFNLLVDGRKLAGLAMRRRMRDATTVTLVHACLWVGGALEEPIAAINHVESRLGLPGIYRTEACITLAEATAWTGRLDSLSMAFADAALSAVFMPTC
ncbi:lipoyl protein ligase domain-containing protein [Henriciella litoralis]|uniref:lipoyl protein ligase domain-containing protein n=1 Tax=Henriciella litoralis TaxID=568102 RepID=UPI000A01AD5C|nr:hypothetical protein [Henriciella litoralis]